jgi:hypothetical protein
MPTLTSRLRCGKKRARRCPCVRRHHKPPPFEALGWLILVWGAYRSPDAAVNSFVAIKGFFWCLHIETYRAHSGFLTLFRTSLSLNGGMKGPVRWTDGTGTLTMDSPSHRREGEPVLKGRPGAGSFCAGQNARQGASGSPAAAPTRGEARRRCGRSARPASDRLRPAVGSGAPAPSRSWSRAPRRRVDTPQRVAVGCDFCLIV